MSDIKIQQSFSNLKNALDRLEEALQESTSQNSLSVDGTIQRFEFVIELFWKTLKRLLEAEGIIANTPKETLKKAFSAHWIDNETAWLQMLHDRNETSHVYDQNKANEIYGHIKEYFPELKNRFTFLQQRYQGYTS